MTKHYPVCECSREILGEGNKNRLEAALDVNGEMSVLNELDQYLTMPRRLEQQKAVDLMNLIDLFCTRPEGLRKVEFKYLRNEIWELKLGAMRMLLYATNCSSVRKNNGLLFPTRDQQAPNGCNTARATNVFEKKGDKTPAGQIQKAIGIAREDGKQ